jgi:hypothetical protein
MDLTKLDLLEFLLDRSNVAGLGEIGLDYSRNNNVDHDIQKAVFRAQLKLAMRLNKGVCLHIRKADEQGFIQLEEVILFGSTLFYSLSLLSSLFRLVFPKSSLFMYTASTATGTSVRGGSTPTPTARSGSRL